MGAGKVIGSVLGTLLVVGGLGAGGYYLYKQSGVKTPTRSEKVYVQKVSAINTVYSADLMAMDFAGVIVAQKSVDVKYDTTQTIDEILVHEGDTVKKGDKLLTYNVENIQLKIEEAKLEVERTQSEIESNKSEIAELEAEKRTASGDAAVSLTTRILALQSTNARSEYDIKAKNVEIAKLESSLETAFVTAPIDGTVKELKEPGTSSQGDDYGYGGYGGDSADVIMKISASGDFRVKGMCNEQNRSQISKDAPVILKSRVDDTAWHGSISEVDTNPATDNNNDMYNYGESDEMGTSSQYAFYVEPESLEGFMLGQHVLIQLDNGQDEEKKKTGIWLYNDFVVWDGTDYYVWAQNQYNIIEKRKVEIGEIDNDYGDIEIVSGLTGDDYIAFPALYIEAGMGTTTNQSDKDIPDNAFDGMYGDDDMYDEGGMYDEGMYDGGDYEMPDNIEVDEKGNTIITEEDGTRYLYTVGGEAYLLDDDGNRIPLDENGEPITDGGESQEGEPAEGESESPEGESESPEEGASAEGEPTA